MAVETSTLTDFYDWLVYHNIRASRQDVMDGPSKYCGPLHALYLDYRNDVGTYYVMNDTAPWRK